METELEAIADQWLEEGGFADHDGLVIGRAVIGGGLLIGYLV